MASVRLQVIAALRGIAESVLPDGSVRGFDKAISASFRAGAGGTIVGRLPSDVPEPEIDLSPLTYHYDYPIQIEVLAPENVGDATAWLDERAAAFGAAIAADRTLGGLCSFVDATMPEEGDFTGDDKATQRFSGFAIVASFSTTNPLS